MCDLEIGSAEFKRIWIQIMSGRSSAVHFLPYMMLIGNFVLMRQGGGRMMRRKYTTRQHHKLSMSRSTTYRPIRTMSITIKICNPSLIR